MKTTRPVELDFADIQGNILTAYGRLGFPKGRFLLLNIADQAAGRAFVTALRPKVTTALRWQSAKHISTGKLEVARPLVTVNVAFTFWGLAALGVPVRTLRDFPDEFIDGMARRKAILGDDFPADCRDKWDRVWRDSAPAPMVAGYDPAKQIHMLVMLNAQMDAATGLPVPELEAETQAIRALCAAGGGKVSVLSGHNADGQGEYQELSALLTRGNDGCQPIPYEHFGYLDGISDPVFDGQYDAATEAIRVIGNGKMGKDGVWRPLAAGEFLLGYADEAQEVPLRPMPLPFSRNGTFMAYRKLQENVAVFRGWLDATAPRFAAAQGLATPAQARTMLMAKMCGRWPDGVPLTLAPTWDKWQAFNNSTTANDRAGSALSNFTYFDDADGSKCPVASHSRRVNPRDTLGPLPSDGSKPGPSGTVLANRRRILRRGLPYGTTTPEATADAEVGIVMLNVCASLARQYEFVQQQWLNYGLDASVGNDRCPLLGIHDPATSKFVIPGDPATGAAPFIADQLPQLVEARGGDYFFVPSLPALAMIGMGTIDPT